MPIIIVEGPSLSAEKKRQLVTGLTDAAAGAYEFSPDSIVVVFHDLTREDVAQGGELLADAQGKSAGQRGGAGGAGQRRAGQTGAGQRGG